MNQRLTIPMHSRLPVQAGLDRTLELLAELQAGPCSQCGWACYRTRRQARRAARIAAPGRRLRAYRCGDAWHLTSYVRPPSPAAPITASPSLGTDKSPARPLATPTESATCRAGLALDREAERASTRGHHQPPRHPGRPPGSTQDPAAVVDRCPHAHEREGAYASGPDRDATPSPAGCAGRR